MSDFFMPTQNNTDQEAEKYRSAVKSVQNQEIEDYKQKKQQHLENWDRYGVNVPDEYYDAFNKIIAQAPTPEEAQEEAYKIGSAVKYSEAMGIPLLEAYENVDAFNEAQFTDLQGQKGRFEALSDMLNLGRNNVKLGRLGQELMQAHGNNDKELANALMAEIDAINQQNQLMQDNAPRSWVMQALEAGAQSLPFTGVVAGAGIVGNFIAPAAGTAASFAASSYLSAGTEYIDMIANGASPETARLVATVSGGIQGLIEADLGISKSIVKSTARVIGKEAAENAAKKSVEEIGRKVFKRFHFGAGKKVLINYLENRGKDILGEGTEEFLQEITSIVGQEVAASLDGYDIPDDDFKSIVKQTTEAFRGGVLGALSMGFIPAGINAAADVREYKLIKDTAELFESEEMFKEAAKDSPVFEGMSDEAKADTIHEVWQRAQNRKEIEAQQIAEGRDAAEGAEEAPAENEDGSTEANPVARDDFGKLNVEDEEYKDSEGNVTGGTYWAGDPSKSENNRYGYIKYSQDKEGNITIDNFKMTEGRDGLREELFDQFAREHPDVKIDWNAIGPDMQEAKQALIDANPSGAKNGLNYYTTEELNSGNIAARKKVISELKKNIYNYTKNTDGTFTRSELTNKQLAAGVALIESAARRMGMGLNDYINKTFGNQIFGSYEDFANASLAQGEDVTKKAGGMYQGVAQANWKEVGQQIKAVIYAGEHADFSTWAHEMAHVFQNQLDGDLKTEAEAAFNVTDGDWINSTYKFKDGREMSSAEAFAYGFQDWLETGKAENEQMQNIFQKFAEFIADCYNRLKKHLDFTPEIESVFNKLLDGDDTIMSKALRAAQEQENEYRASLKRQAEETKAAKKTEKEQAEKQAQAEREEASESTDFTEEKSADAQIADAENRISEVTNETEKTDNAIDNALENTNLSDEQKEQIAETLKDESSTIVEKAEATTEAAESAYDDIDLFQDEGGQRLLSQLAGEPSIRRMAESEEKERILADLEAAQLLDDRYKSMDAKSKASRIRMMTGWEKDATGKWKYETDDSLNRIKTEFFKNNPEVLSGSPYLLNLGDILEAKELYKVFPYMENVRVSFYSDPNAFRAVLTPQGIKVNTRYLQGMDGEKGLKGVLAHEIQHVIQAMEYAESKGLQGADIEQLYNDMMGAMQAAGERKYDYDITSLQQGLDAYMQDAGEIEARNVARRIMMNADQRRMNTLASTEDVQRKVLFQETEEEIFKNAPSYNSETDDVQDLKKSAYKYAKEKLQGQKISNNTSGENVKIEISSKGINEWYSKTKTLDQAASMMILDQLLSKAEYENTKGNKHNAEDGEFDYYNSPTVINGNKYVAKFSVKSIIEGKGAEEKTRKIYHHHYLDDIKIEPVSSIVRVDETTTALLLTGPTENIAQETEAVKQKNNEYEEAVKAGDTEKVMQMLQEAAEHKGYNLSSDYQGTSAFNGAAPYRNGYYSTKEERLEAVKNEEFEDTATLGDYAYDNADPLGFEYMIEDPRSYRAADEKRKEAIDNLRKAVSEARSGKKNVTIKMYRSVPADIKEGSFRNGDWITPSKSYAKDNADVHGWNEGEYRIIDQDVDLEHIWWDGNDIAEWGYDDEKEAVYKNTENNRKLFEITYDKDGKLIPLSERFDENKPSILFQEVFHGSPHIIKKSGGDVIRDVELGFDHRKMGTGEGAQAFGWGTYVTQVEGIAKNYASKLGQMPYTEEENKRLAEINEIYSAPSKLLISIDSKKDFLKARRTSLRDLDNGKYEARINRNIKEFTRELKAAKKENDADNIKFYEDLINTSIDDLDSKRKEELRKSFQKDIDDTLVEIDNLKKEQKEAAKLLAKQLPDLQKELEEIRTAAKARPAENVYTLDIPDETEGNYIPWNEPLSIEQYRAIYKQAKQENLERFVGYLIEDVILNDNTFTPPTGEWLYKNDLKWDISSDKEKSLFLNRAGITGISYPAQYLSGGREDNAKNYVLFNENDIKVTDWHAKNVEGDILFQEVYHGSGADFDKFDTENFGLSGEGTMSFGYGTYVTDSKDIALNYAERQGNPIQYRIKALTEIIKEEEEILKENISERLRYVKEKDLAKYKEELEKLKEQEPTEEEIRGKRALYTVEIPNDGFIKWDENMDPKIVEGIIKDKGYFYGLKNLLNNYNKWKDNPNATYLYGSNVYKAISRELGSDKAASHFLQNLGFKGIDYPAGTIYGNGDGSRNYVVFNDADAKIVDKLLFQTNAELMNEAQDFDSWQEFMEYCETFHADDEVSPIPGDADAQWYQTFWETSRGVQTEQKKNEETVQAKNKKDGMLPTAVDAYFTTMIRSDPEMVDSFLQAVADIDAIDLDSEEWQQTENAEDAAQRDQIEKLKDFIGITLSDYNWQTALKRIQGGHEISEGLRKRLIGEMTDSFKSRDFRALYAEVMNDPQYAVAEEDSITASLNKKLKKYHDIVKPNDDISRWSPEKRKQLAEQLANREIAAKIKSGSLKLDDELDSYIKSLNKQIKETQDQYNELEKETKADYQRIADKERRDLLKLHEQLLLAKGKLNSRNTEVSRKIAKGLKITDKYRRLTQNLNANYDELFRKYNDLRNTITINAEVQAALDRQEQVAGLREDLNAKQKEKNLTAEVKKMRIQLVKKAMRRVPFNRVDYESARTVIAIQRMLEPNLLGGVNRFIGIDSPYLRGVISQIVTDSDYKEKIMNYLSKNTKASQAFADFKKKLEELKSIKDFDSWTAKERKAAIRYLPKENWVRDLNLKELAKEREESIDLDIGMEEVKRTVYDEKTGEPKTYKDNEGNSHNVTETAFRLKYDEELGRLVQDAVGADMFDKIVNMPFSEWTTEDLETLAQRIDELYTEGRDLKAAKDEARKNEAAAIRKRIEDAIKETGITINDDDTPEEKERKQKQIEKILGMSDDLKGTEAGKPKGLKARLNRLLHSYSDMNVLRFARMLDGQSEGENVRMLYRKEDDCYNAKQRSMNSRAEKIYKVMKDNNITEGDLAEVVEVPSLGTEFTVDELLYFLAADKDYAEDEKKLQRGLFGIDANDDYAATSRNAVMFGNMMSDMMSQEEKESWLQLDKDMEEALQNDTLTQEQKEQLATGQLDKKPGTTKYIMACHAKWEVVLGAANNYLSTHPEYKALMEAIEADYAEQYGRMNEVSINEFNMPVHRVKAYVPLVRRESNGDTNENQVKEDLLGAAGVGKQWADRGMTQRRVQISPLNQKPVQTGLFRTWGDSIERTEHFIAYAPYVRQLNAIYKSRDASYTRRFIESRYGAGAIKYLDEYINEVANPNAGRIRERGAEWLHVLRGKTAPAYLGWKASAIIKQGLTSPWPYMQFVNPAEYVSAAMKFTFNPQMREAIKEKSVFMKMRRMDPVNDLIDEMADNAKSKLDRGWSNFSKLGMQGLELIDWACVAPGWLACYEKKYNQLQNASNARYEAKMAELKERNMYAEVGTSEYLNPQQMEAEARKELAEDIEAEAVRYADDCTRACQPSNRVTDLAPLFKNSSEAMKAFLQFQTSLNVIWQNLRYDMPYAVKNKEFTRIAGTVIGYVCAGIFMNSVMEGIGGDDDDDETQALRNLIYYSTTQFTDSIPIMGSEITNTMDQLITGKRGFYGSGTDMTPSATKLLSVLTTAKNGNWEKAAALTAEGIGLYLGAPVSGAKEINKLLGKPLSEGDINFKRGITDVYGIAGDIIDE